MADQNSHLPDIQATPDGRGIAIDLVGVSELRYPIQVRDAAGGLTPTIAKIAMSVQLAARHKGTHMSRFLEVLSAHENDVSLRTLPQILAAMQVRLAASEAQIELAFTYFVNKRAPISGLAGKVACEVILKGIAREAVVDLQLCVTVPVTTLCPCSKEISDYGAHNQRGYVTLEVCPKRQADGCEWIAIEDLISIAEKSGSAPVYALLKRPDERHVTMQAYENPVFVEDVVRNAAALLQLDSRVASFKVKAVNHESIHDHNAFAMIVGQASG
jgi:GTP cyclohydrolase IB